MKRFPLHNRPLRVAGTCALIIALTPTFTSCGSIFGPNKSSGNDPRHQVSVDQPYTVKRRPIGQALAEIKPLLENIDKLGNSQHLLFQDIAADIVAQLPRASGEEVAAVEQLLEQPKSRNFLRAAPKYDQPAEVLHKDLFARSALVNGTPVVTDEDFEILLPPRKSVTLPARSYCLDHHLGVPYGDKVSFTASSPAAEPNIRLLIAHHEYTLGLVSDYQSLFWAVEELESKWKNASASLKQVFTDLGLPSPDPEDTLQKISESDSVKQFVAAHHLADERLPGIDLQWYAQGYTKGSLSVYNNTDQAISVKPSKLIGRFAATYQVRTTSLVAASPAREPNSAQTASSASTNSCSDPKENAAPDVQDIWAGPAIEENMGIVSQSAWSHTRRVMNAVQTIAKQNKAPREPLVAQAALGADLLSIGATDAGFELIEGASAKAKGEGTVDGGSLIGRVQAMDLSRDELDLDQFLDIAKLIGTHKTSARRFADAIARTQPVSAKVYHLILSLEGVRATDAQIEQIRQLTKARLAADGVVATSLRKQGLSFLADDKGPISAQVTYAVDKIQRYLPEIYTVLSHPSLIPDLGSMWDIQKDAHNRATEAAFKCDEGTRKGLEDGYFDAFRHAYWNAKMTAKHGSCKADWVGSGHEENIVGGNNPFRKEMDLANNKMGRDAAEQLQKELGRSPTDDELESGIRSRLDRGEGKVIQKGSESDPSTWQIVPSSPGMISCP